MKTRNILFSIVLVVVLMLSACATPTATPTQEPQATEPEPTEEPMPEESSGPVRLIGNGALEFASLDVQHWQDLLKEQGMDVEFNWVDSPDTSLRAIIAGSADAYVGSLTSAVLATANADANLKIIAVNNQATDYVLLVPPEITSLEDLEGKTIGISTPGSAADTIIRTALQKEGIDPEFAEWVNIGGTSARITALLAGQIDAAPAHAADAAPVVATGEAHVVLNAGESIGSYLQSGLIASGEWLESHPDQAQQVVDAFIEASRWAVNEKEDYIALSNEFLPDDFSSDEERANTYDLYIAANFWPVDGGLGQEAIDAWIELEQGSGGLPEELPDQAVWLDDSFVKNYLANQ